MQFNIFKNHTGVSVQLLAACLLLGGCSSKNMQPKFNVPGLLKTDAQLNGDSTHNQQQNQKRNDILFVVSFSGGGTRSAALSYGVLKALDNITLDENRSMLDEVDFMSSVSGGSFVSAYYGLFTPRFFTDFKNDVLYRQMQQQMKDRLYSFSSLSKLSDAKYSRSDFADDYYNEVIFKNKTFADMRSDTPKIIINSTDIGTGHGFSFTQKSMSALCSNLNDFPVSRAVTASSAVPLVFSPITLKNYANCSLPHNTNMQKNSEFYSDQQVPVHVQYADKTNIPYVHLVDGGIVDNLGVRSVIKNFNLQKNGFVGVLDRYANRQISDVVFLTVDAANSLNTGIPKVAQEPSVSDVVDAAATIQMGLYSRDTLDLLRQKTYDWQKEVNQCIANNDGCKKLKFHIININLQQLPKDLAQETSRYPTALELTKQQVDTLIDAGEYLVIKNKAMNTLIRTLVK